MIFFHVFSESFLVFCMFSCFFSASSHSGFRRYLCLQIIIHTCWTYACYPHLFKIRNNFSQLLYTLLSFTLSGPTVCFLSTVTFSGWCFFFFFVEQKQTNKYIYINCIYSNVCISTNVYKCMHVCIFFWLVGLFWTS